MKYVKIAACAAVLVSGAAFVDLAQAAGKPGGASTAAPGQEFKGTNPAPVPDAPGASGWAPGREKKAGIANPDPDAPGASGYAPGSTISKGKK